MAFSHAHCFAPANRLISVQNSLCSRFFRRSDLTVSFEWEVNLVRLLKTRKSDSDPLPMMLIVGDIAAWNKAGRQLPDLEGFYFTCLEHVTPELLSEIRPDIILCSLVSDKFDAIELGERLAEIGYAGRFRALCEALPRPETVRKEIRALIPGLDFDLLILNEEPG